MGLKLCCHLLCRGCSYWGGHIQGAVCWRTFGESQQRPPWVELGMAKASGVDLISGSLDQWLNHWCMQSLCLSVVGQCLFWLSQPDNSRPEQFNANTIFCIHCIAVTGQDINCSNTEFHPPLLSDKCIIWPDMMTPLKFVLEIDQQHQLWLILLILV